MTHAQQKDRSVMLPLMAAACILYAFVCIPAFAETGNTDPVSGVQPVTIKIAGDSDRQDLQLRSADSSGVTITAAPDLLWRFAVFWDYQFYGKTAIPAVDGGYLIAGESRMNGTEESAQGAAIVLEEPSNGTTTWKWAWLYGTDGTYDSFSDAAADGTSGYVFVGGSKVFNPPGTDGWLLHTDTGGYGDSSAYWQRTWPGADSRYADQFNAVVRTTDGGFAASGMTGSYHPNETSNDAWLIRTDNTGTTTGSGAYDGTVPKSAESLRQTSDGGFILAGSDTPAGGSGTKLLLIRLNADNSVRWQKEFGNNPGNGAYDVRETTDGGFIAAGYTTDSSGHRSIYLVRTDGNGNALWEATPASGRTTAEGHGVVQTDDGGFLVAGSSGGALVVKVDSTGATEWENVYVTEYPDSTVASLEKTDDGGFLISGTRIQPDEENPGFQIIKLGPIKTVQQPVALPGMTNLPTDPDGDGLYEDLNGNGRADFSDIVLFFSQIEWIAENEPVPLFDFNGNGRIDFNDIVTQFEEL
jgi:PKD repeat protein